MSAPWRRRLRVLAVNAAVLAGALGAVEGAVRATHPQIRPAGVDRRLIAWNVYGGTAAPSPGASGQAMGVVRHVDARGLWRTAAAHAPQAPDATVPDATALPERPGWLFLGDSVTMGLGVADDSTFTARLSAAQASGTGPSSTGLSSTDLSGTDPSGTVPVDVQNAALVGYDAADYVAVLRGRLARPDALALRRVTVVWCLNDVYAGAAVAGVPGGGRVLGSPVAAWVRRHVRTVAWAKATFADRPLAHARFDAALYAPGRAHLDRALAHLDTLAATARRAGLALDVVLVPYEAQLRASGVDRSPQRRLAAALARRGVPVRDLAPAFLAARDARALYLYGDGIHLSDAGHRLVARELRRTRP